MKQKIMNTEDALVDAEIYRQKLIQQREKQLEVAKSELKDVSAQKKNAKYLVSENEKALQELSNSSASDYLALLAEKRQKAPAARLLILLGVALAVSFIIALFIAPAVAGSLLIVTLGYGVLLLALNATDGEFLPSDWFTLILLFLATAFFSFGATLGILSFTMYTEGSETANADSSYYFWAAVAVPCMNVIVMSVVFAVKHVRYAKQKQAEQRETVLKELQKKAG